MQISAKAKLKSSHSECRPAEMVDEESHPLRKAQAKGVSHYEY